MKMIIALLLTGFAITGNGKPSDKTPTWPVRVEVAGNSLVVLKPAGVFMQFYLFDVDGTLVRQVRLKHTRELVDQLKKGTYLYSALKNDDLIASGYVSIK